MLCERLTSCCLFLTRKKTNVIETFSTISRYQDDLLNIDNPYFEQMLFTYVQLNLSDIETNVLDLDLSIHSFIPKFTINKMILILKKLVNVPFLDMFLALLCFGYIYHS